MGALLCAALVLYWACGSWFMITKAIPGILAEVTLLDVFFAVSVFWVIGPIMMFAYWADQIVIIKRKPGEGK